MANISTPKDQNISKRNPKCSRCRNHGFVVQLKGHAGKCPFRPCRCWKCTLISERTKIMATQRGFKKRQREDKMSAEKAEVTPAVSTEDETGPRGSGADLRPSPEKKYGCSNVLTDSRDRSETVIKTSDRRIEVHRETYTELEIPVMSPSSSSLGTSESRWRPDERIGDMSRQSFTSYCWSGGKEDSVFRDPRQFPWEYIITAPKNIFPSEMLAMPSPFRLHSHYPDGYALPPLMVSLDSPVPGAYKVGTDFPHLPLATLACPPGIGAPQGCPWPFYASGPQPSGLVPHDYHLYNKT
ncbi:uncharacterized protein LOC143475316 [Brachyhypopomus gauderio]|uniref:uncharacterized protein LOC143475316 n=1 Tax=Brachyhypopomus gauderio TaxID=698409 RepID=UPI00404182A8